MSDFVSMVAGVIVGIGTLAVIVFGIYFDQMEYERRQEERRLREKEKARKMREECENGKRD